MASPSTAATTPNAPAASGLHDTTDGGQDLVGQDLESPEPPRKLQHDEYAQVPSELACVSWNASTDDTKISLWNTHNILIVVVPLQWALECECRTLAGLSLVVDMMFEKDVNTPLMWAKKEEPGTLLSMEDSVEALDYVVYRSELRHIGLIPSGASQTTPTSDTKSTTSHNSDRSNNFRNNVLQRDQDTCVVSGMIDDVQAAHLVPRGDRAAYSSTITPADGVAAGVALFAPLHGMYDRFEAAFLPLAEDVKDVKDDEAKDGKGKDRKPWATTRTFQFHIFRLPRRGNTTSVPIWDGIRATHGRQCTWYSAFPDPTLARVHYTRVLLQRFAVVARTMAPPPIPKKHCAPSAPGTPKPAKKTKATPQDTP